MKNIPLDIVTKINETYKDDQKKQIKELRRCVIDGRKSGNLLLVGAAYCCLSEICTESDDLHGMLVNSLKAVTILKDTDQYVLTARAYFVLGHAYLNQGNYQMSLVCDEIAYRIVKKHRIKGQLRITALNNLSVSYHAMEETRKSINYLSKCIDLLKEESDDAYTDLVMYSINLAGCYKDVGESEQAENTLAKVFDILEKVDFSPLVCDYYLRRAIIAYMRKDIAAGNGYMDDAFDIFPKNVYPLPIYDDLCEVAHVITKNNDKVRSDKIFELMTVYEKNGKGTLEQLFANRMMADYYKQFGEYKLSAEHYAKCEELNERQMRELKEMQMKLHNAAKNTEAEIRRLNRKMRENEKLVSREPMTKLLNRSALLTVSAEFIALAAKKKQKVGAIFIDIDFFKECNDTYGHAKGDEIIKEVASVCKDEETANIRFARYGGDEFFGITRGLTDSDVADIARRILRRVRGKNIPNEKNPNGHIITLSVGIVNVNITSKTDTIIEIANYADKAVYHAKNAGRNVAYFLNYDVKDISGKPASYLKIDF